MNREALDKIFERSILGLLLAILVFAPLAFGAVDAWAFLVVQALTILVTLAWALRLWFSPKPQLLWSPLCWAVLGFTALAIGRYLTADIEYVARMEWLQVLVFTLLFFAIVNNCYRQETVQIISYTLIAVATLAASYAVFQWLTHSNRVWNEISPYAGRASGTYISPNNLAGLLEMILPLTVALLLVGRMNIVTRILLGYAVLVIGAGLAVTFSRGGWLATAAGLLALLLVLVAHKNHRWRALLLLVVLLSGGFFFSTKYLAKSAGYAGHVKDVQTGALNVDVYVRLKLWLTAERMWRDNFWWGVGPAHFDYRFREYRPARVQMRPDRAHNDYANLLADWGTVGAGIVLAGIVLFATGLAKTWRHVRRSENDFSSGQSNRFAFYLGAGAGLLALAVHSVADFNLHIPANALVGVTLLALLSSHLRFATETYWFKVRGLLKILATVALAGGIFYLAAQEWRRGHETAWLARAGKFPELFSAGRAAALQKAFAAEPENFDTAYALGEMLRAESFNGGDNYEAQAKQAMDWFAIAARLNPHDGYSRLRTGMCLDWLGEHDAAEKFFSEAEALDPNGYYTIANVGWHYVQAGDFAAARPWFQRSLCLESDNNEISHSYLDLVEQKLQDRASGQPVLPAGF